MFQDKASYRTFGLEISNDSPRGNCFVHWQAETECFFQQRMPLQVSREDQCTVTNLKYLLI
jgi:hypothetical protein